MNRKQFVTLIVLGLVVGGLGLYLYNQRKQSFTASSFETGARVFKDFPLNEVAHIRVVDGTSQVNLDRSEEGWTVKERFGYPANFNEISEFLRKVWELKPVQEVEAGASQYGRLSLQNPAEGQGGNAGTLVEFKDAKEGNLRTMVLGKKQTRESPPGPFGGGGEFPVGRYVLVPENPAKVWLVSETFSNVEPRPEQWIEKDWFKVEKVKSVSVTSPNPTNTWTLSRETEGGEWKLAELAEGEKLDSGKASSLNYLLSSPSFNDIASPETKIETNELAQAKIETFDGLTYAVKIGGESNGDNLLMKVNVSANLPKERPAGADEKPEDKERLEKDFKDQQEKLQAKLKNEQRFNKWTYQVSKWTVDALLKPRSDFMARATGEKTASDDDDDHGHDHDADGAPVPALPPELRNILPPGAPE